MTNENTPFSVLLADDHPLFRAGVRQVTDASNTHRIIAEVGDGQAAVDQINSLLPDFALLDLSMPILNGFEVMQTLNASQHKTKFVIISMFAHRSYAERARELGAIAFIAKEDAITELQRAFNIVDGEFFTSQSVGLSTLELLDPISAEQDVHLVTRLSEAERRVLILVGKGFTSKEIARQLNISPRTVDAHRSNSAEKIAVKGRNKLIEFSVKNLNALRNLKT